MNSDMILSGVRNVLFDTFMDDSLEIDRATTAIDVPGWDSLSHTIVILSLEKHFGITILQDAEFADVGAIVDTIADLLDRSNRAS